MPSFPWIKSQQFYTLSCFLSLSSISSHANDNVQFDDCVHVRRRLLASPSLPPVYTVLYIHNAYIYFICIYIYVHKNSRAFMKFVRVCICVCVYIKTFFEISTMKNRCRASLNLQNSEKVHFRQQLSKIFQSTLNLNFLLCQRRNS